MSAPLPRSLSSLRRRLGRAPWLGLVVALVPLGCRFRSVSPVSDSIVVTIEHREAVSLGEPLCRLGTAMVSDAPGCDDRAAHIEQLQLALEQLQRYGDRLARLAGTRPPDLGAAPGAMISMGETLGGTSMSGVERKGIETAAKILTDVVTTQLKRRALRRALTSTDRSVQCLAWRSVEATEVWRRELARIAEAGTKADALDIVLDPSVPRREPAPPAPAPPAPELDGDDPLGARLRQTEDRLRQTDERLAEAERDLARTDRRALESERLALRSVQVLAAEHDRRLAALERGLWAVAIAHHHLACHAERLGTTRDKDLRQEIDRRVACVLERDRPEPERSAACRPVLADAEARRAHACEDLLRDGADGQPEPLGPDCQDRKSTP